MIPNPFAAPGQRAGDHAESVSYQVEAEGVQVRLVGEIDMICRPRLEEVIAELARRPPCAVTVDLTRVTFLASDGLAFMARLRRHLGDSDAPMTLVAPSPQVWRVLMLSGMDHLFTILP